MKPIGRGHLQLLGLIVSICFATLPNTSTACPKPCACYVSTEVHCTFRYLTSIPRQIQTDVERINLGYNSLNKLGENDFSGLKKLELLMLHSNEIQSIHESAFNDLSSLQVLKMSYNKVKSLHKNTFHGLKNMVRLHMDHNKLEFLNPESFYGLTSLKLVHLEGNLLRQLHTDTFVTLRYIQIFKTSTIKHIYLSDNHLSSLPKEMFLYMTELEGLYLHGNPWSCDCNLQWLTEWTQQSRDIIKCKRDRSGVQCPVCASPRKNMGRSLIEISSQQLTCVKPTIENIFKIKNMTTPDEGGFTAISPKDFVAPMGTLILNMTDQAGNEANLACSVRRPTKMSQVTLDIKEEYTTIRTTFSSFLVCSIDYDHIQKIWGILAMYSDSPLKLKRDLLLTKIPFISYKYIQSTFDDEVFTDIEAELRAEPNWLMQDMVTLQLDRTATTLNTLHIRYSSDVSVTVPNVVEKPLKSNWVLIQKNNHTKTEYAAVIGGTIEMNCQVLGEPAPAIEWVLPDGTKIRAPYTSVEGRVTITRSGKFILKAADSFDTGIYHCIATNYIDADVQSFRITVVNPDVEEKDVNSAEFTFTNGDELYLPCGSNGIPDASVSWILPDHSVLHETSRYKHIFKNGTLQLQHMTQRDRGHFRCIAANQFGIDILTFRVLSKEENNDILNEKISFEHNGEENNEASGIEEIEEETKHSARGKAIEHRRFPIRVQTRDRSVKLDGKLNRNIGGGITQGRNQISKRPRGHRRQFNQSTRRIDPQRWSEILEKTKQNAISNKKMQVIESSTKGENYVERVSGDLEEASGEGLLPVEETFIILTTKQSTANLQTEGTTKSKDNISLTKNTSVSPITYTTEKEKASIEKENNRNIEYSAVPTIPDHLILKTSVNNKQYIDTITHATVQAIRDQPTTQSYLNSTSVAVITKPPIISNIKYVTSKDVTTNSILPSTPHHLYVKPQTINNDLTFHASTGNPQYVSTNPSTTTSYYTESQHVITTVLTTPRYTHATSQQSVTKPSTLPDNLFRHNMEVITKPSTTSSYLKQQEVLTNPSIEFSHVSTPPNFVTSPKTKYDVLPVTPHIGLKVQPTTSTYFYETPQKSNNQSNHLLSASKDITYESPTTYSPFNVPATEILSRAPTTQEYIITNTPTDPTQFVRTDILESHKSNNIPDQTITGRTDHPNIISTLPHATGNYFFSKPLEESVVVGTITIPNTTPGHAKENFLHSQDKLPVQSKDLTTEEPNFPATKKQEEKTNAIAIDSATKASAKLFLSQTEIGPIYIHSTQKIISPRLPSGSTIITHQQIQILKNVTPYMPTARRYGRRRIAGKRRIIRPDRIPNIRDHKFKFGKAELRETTQSTTTETTISELRKQGLISLGTSPSAMTLSPPMEYDLSTSPPHLYKKETSTKLTTKVNNVFTNNNINNNTSTQYIAEKIKMNTEKMTILDTSLQGFATIKPYTTTQIPTIPIKKEVYTYFSMASPTTKTRPNSKILRRKIPWHRLFGNSQIIHREILHKLKKNTQVTQAIPTTKPTTTVVSTVSKATTAPPPTLTNKVIDSTTWTTRKPTVTTENILSSNTFWTYTVDHISPTEDTTISHTNTLSSTATPTLFMSTDTAAKQKTFRRKRPRKKNMFNSSVLLNNQLKISKTNISTDIQAIQKPFVLKTSTGHAEQEVPKSYTVTQSPQYLTERVLETETLPLSSIPNDILSTTRENHFVSKTPNTHNPFSQPLHDMKILPKPLPTPYIESFDKKDASNSGQTMERETEIKDTLISMFFNTKSTPTEVSEIVTTTPSFPSLTYKETESPTTMTLKPTEPKPVLMLKPVLVIKNFVPRMKNKTTIKSQDVTERSIPINTPHINRASVNNKPVSKVETINVNKTWSEKKGTHKTTTIQPTAENIRSRPRIIGGKAASFTVLANSDAFIPCNAIGNPIPTILWTKVSSGTFISKSRRANKMEVFINGTLSIPSVSIQDSGQYLCVATNQHGSDRLLVTLSVITYPPRILQGRSTEITVHSGSPVNVKCQAEGRPFPTITWILANETIASETSVNNRQVSVQSDGTLTIKAVTIYDRGLYKCLATNQAGADTLTVRIQVIAAPPIILEAKREIVQAAQGQNVRLHCTAKGNPHPSVHWVAFDGTQVKPLQYVKAKLFLFSNGTLYIRNVDSSDSGHYECIATSSTGSERRVVNLMVENSDTIPKIVIASPKTTEMSFGDKLMLNCTATGEPKPRIIWRLPSKAVVDQWHRMGSRIQVYSNGSIFIESVNEKDEGDYLCVARNKLGDDLILMKVSVTMKPAKIIQKQHHTKQVPYGKDFKVDCKASGSPSPEISWSLPDGTMINNILQADDSGRRSRRYILFDNGTLYLNKVGINEEGDYTCYAENTLGKDQMKVHITVVTAAPKIKLNQKTPSNVRAGDSAVLDCEATGEPTPKIFWLLPSSDMIAASHDRYTLHENGSLLIRKIKLLDTGEYMCVARNPAGDDTKLLKLIVQSKPPIINGLYSNRTVIKDTATKHSRKLINCRADGSPPLQIMWIMPDNIYLTAPYHGSRIIVHMNGTLEIRNVRPSDTAEFTCVARNDGGESMLVVQLEVVDMLRRPMFKNPFNEKIIAKPGKMAILNCLADGNPAPEIIWLLSNGTRLVNGQKLSKYQASNNGTFIIYHPTKDDAGKYRCAARNKVGYIEKLIILEIGQKPTILTHPRGPIKSIIGEALSLHCLSDGIPRPSFIWTLPSGYIIDRPQVNGKYMLLDNGTLVIQETTIHDRGNYLCKAKNNAGEAAISVPVMVVAYPPRITNKPPQNIHTRVGSAVHLNCMAIGIPKPEISWELPDLSILSTASKGRPTGTELLHPQGTLVVQNPRHSDSGMYKCMAKNPLGTDISSTYLNVI